MASDRDPIYRGRLSDGRSAASQDVEVRLTGDGLDIRVVATGETQHWSAAALKTGTSLLAQSQDVVLRHTGLAGAALHVRDAEFVARLAAAVPRLTVRAERRRVLVPMLIAVGIAAGIIAIGWIAGLQPARAVARLLPDQVRATIGDQAVDSMIGTRRRCTNAEGRAAVERLASRLLGDRAASTRFEITVVDWGLVNAFATPGERIVLTRGLIEKAGGPDEVAGVLAHEIGHGLARHPEAAIVRALGLSLVAEVLFGGASGALGNVGVLLAQLSYTRDAEREADQIAFRLLREAGISPAGIAEFFRRVERQDSQGPIARIDILRTHPQVAERAAEAARQPAYPSTPALPPAEWAALRAICAR